MLKLNNNGDATRKYLNLDLFNRGGGYSVLWYEFIQIQNVIFHFFFFHLLHILTFLRQNIRQIDWLNILVKKTLGTQGMYLGNRYWHNTDFIFMIYIIVNVI